MIRGKSLLKKAIALFLALFLLFTFIKTITYFLYPRKYSDLVERYSDIYQVSPAIVYAVIKTESSFHPQAISSAGAMGLMQIMPTTFLWLAELMGESHTVESLYDPEINIRYGIFYLKYLLDRYQDYRLALAAYNAGPGNVEKWLSSDIYAKEGALVFIPFSETRSYVKKVLRRTQLYEKLYHL